MNQAKSESEPDFFNYQPDQPAEASTSQWRKTADRFRGIDDDDPLWIPEAKLSGAVLRRIGDKILRGLALDLGSPPTTKPDQPLKPNPPPLSRPEWQPVRPTPRQRLRRRVGALALAISLGAGSIAFGGPKLIESLKSRSYDVSDRTPTNEEICTIQQAGQQALLVIAAEFTNDPGSRRAAAKRIGHTIRDQDDPRFAVCYSQINDYSRVLTDEAVANLPAERLVSWESFPGRTNR